jgi:hypothetical protein
MAGRTLAVTALLWMLTAYRQEELPRPVTPVDVSQPQSAAVTPSLPEPPEVQPEPGSSCYSFTLLRPRDQRAIAVQARLKQADTMIAALNSRVITVDLVGDHANILSLQFPVRWPAPPLYSDRVSALVEKYFASPDVEDDLCNSGFDQVRLQAWGTNDRRIHPIWTARVTSEGLLKLRDDGEVLAAFNPSP